MTSTGAQGRLDGAATPQVPSPLAGSRAPVAGAALARGGAANLVGALVYGASNFVLLIVLNRGLGVARAGVVVVAIAVFNVAAVVCALGASTGLVRTISRLRATDEPERVPATLRAALVPVAVLSTVVAALLWALAGGLTAVIADGSRTAEAASVLRWMAPFLPFAALHFVIIQGTRGFDTMLPLVTIERVGRALALPLVVGLVALAGGGPRPVGAAWAATNVVALGFSAASMRVRTRRVVEASGREPAPLDRKTSREFWAFTAPRAVGQTSEVAINWFDTILVGAILGTTAAGIYASGTRYLQPGMFASEALMQVSSPRLSGLMATGDTAEASRLAQLVGGWQTVVIWPIYLLVLAFPHPLLALFGEEVVAATDALRWLCLAMLATIPLGPAAAVILMGGRSRQAMFNTLAALAVNIGGNLAFVERYGISAAGGVWAATILVGALLPTWQAHRSLEVTTPGRPALVAMALAAATVGLTTVTVRFSIGDDLVALLVAGSVGTALYVVGLWWVRSALHLDIWWAGIRRKAPNSPATPLLRGPA